MAAGLAFWILMMIWFIFGLVTSLRGWPAFGPAGIIVSNLLLFVLFGLIGWHVFGAVLNG